MRGIFALRDFALRLSVDFLKLILPETLVEKIRDRRSRAFGNRYYSQRARNYDQDRAAQPSWMAEFEALEKVAAKLGRDLHIADMPVGTGRFFPIYEKLNWQVTGLDVSRDMLMMSEKSAEKSLSNLYFSHVADARRLSFSDESFDGVVCFRFLQSIVDFGDAQLALGEMARVAKYWVILHLNVNPDSSSVTPFPPANKPMKGLLNLRAIEELLESKGLRLDEVVGPMPGIGKNEYVILCRK